MQREKMVSSRAPRDLSISTHCLQHRAREQNNHKQTLMKSSEGMLRRRHRGQTARHAALGTRPPTPAQAVSQAHRLRPHDRSARGLRAPRPINAASGLARILIQLMSKKRPRASCAAMPSFSVRSVSRFRSRRLKLQTRTCRMPPCTGSPACGMEPVQSSPVPARGFASSVGRTWRAMAQVIPPGHPELPQRLRACLDQKAVPPPVKVPEGGESGTKTVKWKSSVCGTNSPPCV